jgi:hypothetical protein
MEARDSGAEIEPGSTVLFLSFRLSHERIALFSCRGSESSAFFPANHHEYSTRPPGRTGVVGIEGLLPKL